METHTLQELREKGEISSLLGGVFVIRKGREILYVYLREDGLFELRTEHPAVSSPKVKSGDEVICLPFVADDKKNMVFSHFGAGKAIVFGKNDIFIRLGSGEPVSGQKLRYCTLEEFQRRIQIAEKLGFSIKQINPS